MAASYASIWAGLGLLIPNHWLGLNDGYFYQLFIKGYQLEWIPTDYNSHDIPSYPVYGFYLIAKLGALLRLSDPSRSYFLLLVIASALAVVVGYWLLRPFAGHRSALSALAALIVWPYLIGVVNVYQKPHEFFALVAGVGLVLRLANCPLTPGKRRDGIAIGLLAGFLCGQYLPVMIPAAAAGITMLAWKLRQLSSPQRWAELKALLFIGVIALPIALPQLALLASGVLQHHALPNPEVYYADEFGLVAWIPVWALAALVLATATLVRRSPGTGSLLFGLVGVFTLYAILCLAARSGHPYPVARVVPSFGGMLWVGGCCVAATRARHFIPRFALIPLAAAAILLIVLRLYLGGGSYGLYPTLALTDARANNHHLQEVVRTIDASPEIQRVLANHDYRFVQYYAGRTIFMTLPFNEGYVSRYDDFEGRMAGLKLAAATGTSSALLAWLDSTGTDTVILDGVANPSTNFDIDLLTIAGYPTSGTVTKHIALEKSAVLGLSGQGAWHLVYPNCDCLFLTRAATP